MKHSCILYGDGSSMCYRIMNKITPILKKRKYKVNYYFLKEDKIHYEFMKKKHPYSYNGVLNLCEEKKADILYITQDLVDPDILLMELKARPNLKTKIVFRFLLREIHRSKARANSFKELMNMPQVKFGLLSTLLGKGLNKGILPDTWVEPEDGKVKFISDCLNEDVKLWRKKRLFQYKEKKFTILFFGRIIFAKGIDYLVNSIPYIDENINIIIAGSVEHTHDFDFSIFDKIEKKYLFDVNHNPNGKVIIIPYEIPNEEISSLFNSCRAIIFPYRDSYRHGTSGIFPQACMTRLPIVGPKFFPFGDAINNYKLGLTCNPSNFQELGQTINTLYYNYDTIIKNAGFDDYLKNTMTWEENIEVVFGKNNNLLFRQC